MTSCARLYVVSKPLIHIGPRRLLNQLTEPTDHSHHPPYLHLRALQDGEAMTNIEVEWLSQTAWSAPPDVNLLQVSAFREEIMDHYILNSSLPCPGQQHAHVSSLKP